MNKPGRQLRSGHAHVAQVPGDIGNPEVGLGHHFVQHLVGEQDRRAVVANVGFDHLQKVGGRVEVVFGPSQTVGVAAAILNEGEVDEPHRARLAGAKMEVVVFAKISVPAVEPAHRQLPLATQHHGRGVNQAPHDHLRVDCAGMDRSVCQQSCCLGFQFPQAGRSREQFVVSKVAPGAVHLAEVTGTENLPLHVDRFHVRPDHSDFGMGAKQGDLGRELLRKPEVIGIEQCDELPPGMAKAGVPSGRNALVGLR